MSETPAKYHTESKPGQAWDRFVEELADAARELRSRRSEAQRDFETSIGQALARYEEETSEEDGRADKARD
ncbi:MAG: hypothetical protein OXH22_03890 [Chloroflexi bacterium]|nr:hypothetical protein [Chloroflexota bacterium]